MGALGDVTEERVGQGEPGKSAVSYIDIGSIDRDLKRVGPTEKVTSATAPSRARQWVRSGDVLVSLTRPNLNAVALVTPELDGAVASTGFDILRAIGILPEWVYYRVRTEAFVHDVCEDVQGVVYPAIRPDDVRRHALPLAPLSEQRRIIEAVESYLSRLDAAVASLEHAHARLKAYRASVLKAAVEGRLVPTEAELARAEKRNYEPADVLLKRILAERRRRWEEAELAKLKVAGKAPKDDNWKAKYNEPVAPDTSALADLPEGWCWATLDQLTSLITSGSRGWAEFYSETGPLFIRAQDIKTDALMLDKISRVTPPQSAEGSRTAVRQSDILVTITGANVTKTALVIEPLGEAYVSQHVGLCRPVFASLAPFLYDYIICPSAGRRHLERAAYGAGKPGLNLNNLKEMAIALPPEPEAPRIVDCVLEFHEGAVGSDNLASISMRRLRSLRQAILKWAFDGKLVDQDPREEPAENLLARIRAQRVALPVTKTHGAGG